MIRVPHFEQPTDYGCGPTALQMALAALGRPIPYDVIASTCGTNKQEGTLDHRLVLAAQTFGLKTTEETGASLDRLVGLSQTSGVVIVSYREPSEGWGHLGVIWGISKKTRDRLTVLLCDPYFGEIEMPALDFLGRWRGESDPHHIGWSLELERG